MVELRIPQNVNVNDSVKVACCFVVGMQTLNFRKFKMALNPTYRLFLNFAKN